MNAEIVQKFRNSISEQHAQKGIFCKTTDPAFIESAGFGGLNFAIIDTEHGPAEYKTVEHLVRAAEVSGLASIVRVADNQPWLISKALDTGAAGIQVPNISSVEEAEAAINAARFYPKGMRGVCRFVRAAQYGTTDKSSYFSQANEAIVCLQVEGKQGLDDVEKIIALDGFDILFIGPYDLSQSLGIPGQIYDEKIMSLFGDLAKEASKHGKVLGTFFDELDRMPWFINAGVKYLAYSVDVEIFRIACRQISGKSA